jgi:hypothetical protein
MRTTGLIISALLVAACRPQEPSQSNAGVAEPSPPAKAGQLSWALQSSGDGVALALQSGAGSTGMRLFCPAARDELLVNVPSFKPIGSEERLSFGSGGEVVALVADPGGDVQRGGVSGSGAVLDPGGIVISSAPGNQSKPRVVFSGGNYVVAWVDQRSGTDIYGARVSSAGVVQEPSGVSLVTGLSSDPDPVLVTNGTQVALAWKEFVDGRTRLRGLRSDDGGEHWRDVELADTAGPSDHPRLLAAGEGFLVFWNTPSYPSRSSSSSARSPRATGRPWAFSSFSAGS